MNKKILGAIVLCVMAGIVQADNTQSVLQSYRDAANEKANINDGKMLWMRKHDKQRSCASCHGEKLTQLGKHNRTGKAIQPMAFSVNPERYSDPAKVAKWFKRNCKWTLGRECTAQEKVNVLTWLLTL